MASQSKEEDIPAFLKYLSGRVTLGTKDGAVFQGKIPCGNGAVVFLHGRKLKPTGVPMFHEGTLKIPAEQVAWVFEHRP